MPLLLALPLPTLNSDDGRVQLVPHTTEHHAALGHLLADPKVWEQGFAPGRSHVPAAGAEMAEFLTQRAQVPALFTILVNGQVAGTTGIVRIYHHRAAALIGRTVLGVPFWGGGINRIAKTLLLDWLFAAGARTIECEVAPGNSRSLASLESMGFERRGARRRPTPGSRAPWRALVLLSVGKNAWVHKSRLMAAA